MVQKEDYLHVSFPKGKDAIQCSTDVWKEHILVWSIVFICCIPALWSFTMLNVAFGVMALCIAFLNYPLKEVIVFSKMNNIIQKEVHSAPLQGFTRIFMLDAFTHFKLEESKEKKGAYRLVLRFDTGIDVPLTEIYYFSPNGNAHKKLAEKIMSFLGKDDEIELEEE